MQKRALGVLATTSLMLVCGAARAGVSGAPQSGVALDGPVVAATATTAPGLGKVNKAVLVVDPTDPAGSRIIGTAGLGGLEVYDLAGRRLAAAPAGEAASLDVRSGFDLGGESVALVVSADVTDNSLRYFALTGGALVEVGARPVPLGFAVEGVCLLRNAADGGLYVIAVGDGGEFEQQLVFVDEAGRVDSRQSRRLGLPSPAEHCVADDATGQVYVSEQAVGLWRFRGDPESDATPVLVDAPRLGRITEELGGLALYDGGPGARYLIASDASSGRLFAYDRDADDAWIGAVRIASPSGVTVGEAGGLFATGAALGAALPSGALLAADEDAESGADYKLVSIAGLAGPLNLRPGRPSVPEIDARPPVPTVVATVETIPVASHGDAADDPAIWANPADPAASLVVGTDKKGGLYLYDMQGRVLDHRPDGKMNNVDLRSGFMLGGSPIVLVAASDRTHKSIALYRLDTGNRRLVDIADGLQATDQGDPYGLCLFRSPRTGRTYVFINDTTGEKRQWELVDAGNGRVRAERVRDFAFSSQVEGCVADDAAGVLFVNEEDVGLWRLDAEPEGGTAMTLVQRVDANPALADDLEGVGLYDLGDGRGYLVVSSQGNNTYAVYRREGDQAYLGSFAVVADGRTGIDGVSETDGLEISSADLGPGFEHGAMIAQDGRNVLPGDRQNYKYIPWASIARALGLDLR
jgi:3-phytase